jgi:hypothetical protein
MNYIKFFPTFYYNIIDFSLKSELIKSVKQHRFGWFELLLILAPSVTISLLLSFWHIYHISINTF